MIVAVEEKEVIKVDLENILINLLAKYLNINKTNVDVEDAFSLSENKHVARPILVPFLPKTKKKQEMQYSTKENNSTAETFS